MDGAFFFGIICGALVGVPFSIIANLWTEPVRELLDNNRRIRFDLPLHSSSTRS